MLALGGVPVSAASSAPAHRYLFIVETSRAMQPRKDGALKTLQDLLGSSVGEELRSGSTLGLWTFNDALYAGRFPLRIWNPETRAETTESLLGFVRSQPFEKKAGFDEVSPALNRLVESSDWLTVVLVCSGEERIEGTPFDPAINEFCRTWREQQQTARMPFVVILRAAKGRLLSYTLNCAQWTVELPPLPPEPPAPAPVPQPAPIAKVEPPPPQPASPPPAPVMAAPLILSGRKSEPEKVPPAPAPSPEQPATSASPAATESLRPSNPVPTSPALELPAPVDSKAQPNAEATISSAPGATGAATPEAHAPPVPAPQAALSAPASATSPAMATGSASARPVATKGVLWILGAGVVAGVVAGVAVLLVLWRRRARAHPASFITRSMEKGPER